MFWILAIIGLIIIITVVFEYRFRRPDQIVLYESSGQVKKRKTRVYPRHFSLAIPATTHSLTLKFEAEAKGKLAVEIRIALTIAPSLLHLAELVRVGGWKKDAIKNAAKEVEILLQSFVPAYCDKLEVEELSAEILTNFLHDKMKIKISELGLEIVSLTVQAIDPVDEEITEALQQQEASRIMEQTEKEKQRARVAATKAKIEAEEKIAQAEHELELKRYKLKEAQLERENNLANQKMKEELKRSEMKLHFEKQEIELLSKNPELMVLSPQLTRLAEASQSLKNARTVVSLSPEQVKDGSNILSLVQEYLHGLTKSQVKKK